MLEADNGSGAEALIMFFSILFCGCSRCLSGTSFGDIHDEGTLEFVQRVLLFDKLH